MKKILCLLGFHKWGFIYGMWDGDGPEHHFAVCTRCGKEREADIIYPGEGGEL